MSLRDSLRQGLHLFLLSMGISSPARKPKPAAKPASKPNPGQR
jgi:hypothetical protein